MNITKGDSQGCTSFFLACQNGHLDIVRQLLLDPRVDVSEETNEGSTPFFGACSHGRVEVVTWLMRDARIDINKGDIDGRTPLYMACSHSEIDVVRQLLRSRRVDVNKEEDLCGFTPLILACGAGNLELVQLLAKDKRTDLLAPMKRGLAPLHYSAAQRGNMEIVRWILAFQDPHLEETRKGYRTALKIAQDFQNDEVVQILKDFKSDPVRSRMVLRKELKIGACFFFFFFFFVIPWGLFCVLEFLLEVKPADLFAMVILLCDGYIKLREFGHHTESLEGMKKAVRFFEFAQLLPFDAQMVLCNRARSMDDVITASLLEPSLKDLVRGLASDESSGSAEK